MHPNTLTLIITLRFRRFFKFLNNFLVIHIFKKCLQFIFKLIPRRTMWIKERAADALWNIYTQSQITTELKGIILSLHTNHASHN